jgi:hypothetical protein
MASSGSQLSAELRVVVRVGEQRRLRQRHLRPSVQQPPDAGGLKSGDCGGELGTGGDRVRFVHRGQQPVDRIDALFLRESGEVASGEHADVLAESSCRLGLLDVPRADLQASQATDGVRGEPTLVRTVWQGVAVRHRRGLSDE